MKVTNPIDKELSIRYKGHTYTIPALKTVTLPADVAEHWHKQIHNFLILSNDAEVVTPEPTVADTPVDMHEETTGVVEDEVVEDKPKRVVRSKK